MVMFTKNNSGSPGPQQVNRSRGICLSPFVSLILLIVVVVIAFLGEMKNIAKQTNKNNIASVIICLLVIRRSFVNKWDKYFLGIRQQIVHYDFEVIFHFQLVGTIKKRPSSASSPTKQSNIESAKPSTLLTISIFVYCTYSTSFSSSGHPSPIKKIPTKSRQTEGKVYSTLKFMQYILIKHERPCLPHF